MSARTRRFTGLGMVAVAGAGFLSLAAMMNPVSAHADDIGLVLGGSGTPIPGSEYVQAANSLYLQQIYPSDYSWFGATQSNPFGIGLYTPEGLYPLTGVHTLPLNYPSSGELGLPAPSTSAGQGIEILANQIEHNALNGDVSTVFGYSQSSTIAGLTMEQLKADGLIGTDDVRFLLLGDPSNPNGGLLERFAGFETMTGEVRDLQLNLPSLGVAFDGATPADDYVTTMYSIQYDGFTDFPRYPLNFLADLNAFLGIQTLHGTYLNGGIDGSGPTPEDIANAILLPGSMNFDPNNINPDSLTDYYMITTLGGEDITPPLVALLPAPLQALFGPSLTYLINLGYGDGTTGYSVDIDSPANIPTPFGLFPDVTPTEFFDTLFAKTQEGIVAFQDYLADPGSMAPPIDPMAPGLDFSEFFTQLAADPTGTFTELVDAISTASSAAYSVLLPTADIINALVTAVPAYSLALFTDNLANGDLIDAIGLPLAANTALFTLAAGFEFSVLQDAATQIQDAFSGLF